MQHQLKDLYGRRITSTAKLFILVVLILLGVHLAFGGKDRRDQSNAFGDITGQSLRSQPVSYSLHCKGLYANDVRKHQFTFIRATLPSAVESP